MNRILLVGADGQLGFELLRALAPLGLVMPATLSGRLPGGASCFALDLSQPGSAGNAVRELRPTIVVNAAAYTAVDRAEDDVALARRINAEAVAELAEACVEVQARIVHYSTDYVFPGDRDAAYTEGDSPAPLSVYGQTKREGELAVIDSTANHLIFRTAWVYAARGHNFLRTMLKLAAERSELRVVADQIGSPTPARWLATTTALALSRSDRPSGLWHAVASGYTSWHGFAQAIIEDAAAAGLLTRVPDVVPIATSDFPTRARRPAHSVLDCSALEADFGLNLPDWREGVRHVVAELASDR
ncbi:MAG: dTDP-4-dehydrorhamnose reductase [Gammaproteobacteria bacterium HGW-Gammaproteobacteria-7]|nr:MAG: dTDP-4-dehydrorhamnose reductase [Gammaproteobacteria bacterium HGW-Gammaproteobacteria-7]